MTTYLLIDKPTGKSNELLKRMKIEMFNMSADIVDENQQKRKVRGIMFDKKFQNLILNLLDLQPKTILKTNLEGVEYLEVIPQTREDIITTESGLIIPDPIEFVEYQPLIHDKILFPSKKEQALSPEKIETPIELEPLQLHTEFTFTPQTIKFRDQLTIGEKVKTLKKLKETPVTTQQKEKPKTFLPVGAKKEQKKKKEKEKFIQVCQRFITRTIKQTQKRTKELEHEINAVRQTFLQKTRAQIANHAKQEQLLKRKKEFATYLATEFQHIFDITKVDNVQIENEQLKVRTKDLWGYNKKTNKLHLIGRFEIVVQINNGQEPILFFNLSKQRDGIIKRMMAPNVTPEGKPLFTDEKFIVNLVELISNYEFASVIDLAINFIEKIDSSTPHGAYIKEW